MAGFNINTVILNGNLCADPELREVGADNKVCQLRIASETHRKKNASGNWEGVTGFFRVSVWGGLGEFHSRTLRKGDPITVHGRLNWRQWETDDGTKREAIDIVADSVLPGKRKNDDYSTSQRSDIPVSDEDFAATKKAFGAKEEEIPF